MEKTNKHNIFKIAGSLIIAMILFIVLFFCIKNSIYFSSFYSIVDAKYGYARLLLRFSFLSNQYSYQEVPLSSWFFGYLSLPSIIFCFFANTSFYFFFSSLTKISIGMLFFSLVILKMPLSKIKKVTILLLFLVICLFITFSSFYDYLDIIYIIPSLFFVYSKFEKKASKAVFGFLLVYYLFFNMNSMIVIGVSLLTFVVLFLILDYKKIVLFIHNVKVYNLLILLSIYLMSFFSFFVFIRNKVNFATLTSTSTSAIARISNLLTGNFYLGILPALVPLFIIVFYAFAFFLEKRNRKTKNIIAVLIFLIFLLASTIIPQANHIFDFNFGEQSINTIHVFLIAIILLLFPQKLEFVSKKAFILLTIIFATIFCLFSIFSSSLTSIKIAVIIASIAYVAFATVFLFIKAIRSNLALIGLPLTLLLLLSITIVYTNFPKKPVLNQNQIQTIVSEQQPFKTLISNNLNTYEIKKTDEINLLASNVFSSEEMNDFLLNFGIDYCRNAFSTETILSLLNVKFYLTSRVDDVKYFNLIEETENVLMYENTNAFPFSFFASTRLKSFDDDYDYANNFEFQNSLLKSVSGRDEDIFVKANSMRTNNNVSFIANSTNSYISLVGKEGAFAIITSDEIPFRMTLYYNRVYKLPFNDVGKHSLSIISNEFNAEPNIYCENLDVLTMHRSAIPSDEKFVIRKDGPLSFSSVSNDPNHKGNWYVDGFDCAVINLVDDGNFDIVHSKKRVKPLGVCGFLAFEFNIGVHETSVTYAIKGGKTAFNVTLVGLSLFSFVVTSMLYERRKNGD